MRCLISWCCAGALLLAGCSPKAEPSKAVPISDVPENIRQIAQEKLPDIKFDTAWKIKVDGQDAYELRGKNARGRVREVEVAASGEVLEVE